VVDFMGVELLAEKSVLIVLAHPAPVGVTRPAELLGAGRARGMVHAI
jgi:hypothetical protein